MTNIENIDIIDSEAMMTELMINCGFQEYIEDFKKREIDYECFLNLEEEDLKILFPNEKLGRRIKFRLRLNEWKKRNNLNTVRQEPEPWFISALNSDSITGTPTSSKKPAKVDNSGANLPSLEEILDCAKGKFVQEYFKVNGRLNAESRQKLVECISEYFINAEKPMTKLIFEHCSLEIVNMFPKESTETYFIAKAKNNSLKGKLCNRYYNDIRKYRNLDMFPRLISKRKLLNEEEYTDPVSAHPSQAGTEQKDIADLEQSRIWLKFNDHPWPEVISKWEECFSIRRSSYSTKKIQETVLDWPLLKHALGYTLIELDFNRIYPNKDLAIFTKWAEFSTKILPVYEKQIKDSYSKNLLVKLLSKDITDDYKDCILAALLCSILLLRGKIGVWKPSIIETIQSFILTVEEKCQVRDKLEEISQRCLNNNLTFQPLIIAIGVDSISNTEFNVYFNGISYTFTSFQKALDVCFKLFHALEAEYPRESKLVWTFIQRYFYNIETKLDIKSSSVASLIADLS